MLPSGQKLTFGLLATIAFEVVLFRAYALFPALLPFLKCIVEVMFFKGVQHRLQVCLDHLNCVKMAAFQFLQLVKQRKVGWVGGGNSHVVFGKKFPGQKGSVRRCVVMMQEPVPTSPKFGTKSLHIFTQSP
jgi:hypothetical protein